MHIMMMASIYFIHHNVQRDKSAIEINKCLVAYLIDRNKGKKEWNWKLDIILIKMSYIGVKIECFNCLSMSDPKRDFLLRNLC